MKKTLLLTACILSTGVVSAESLCQRIVGTNTQCVSPDGVWFAGSEDPNVTFYNHQTQKRYSWEVSDPYGIESFTIGNGQCIANDGTAVGGRTIDEAAYWTPGDGEGNGSWTLLPVPNEDLTNVAAGITPDGKYIVGAINNGDMLSDGDEPTQVPVIWERQEDGRYAAPVRLPYPSKDFTGRVAEYAIGLAISDDGTVVGGLMTDYYGTQNQPFVCVKGADGEWTMTLLCSDLINPDKVVFPEYPGEYKGPSNPEWNVTAYMSDDEKEAYEEAYNKYAEGGYEGDAPDPLDYLSEEEKATYEKELAEYQEKYDAWETAFMDYADLVNEVTSKNTSFLMNQLFITPDGKYLLGTAQRVDEDAPATWFGLPYKYSPALIDLSDGSCTISNSELSLMSHQITPDLTVLAANVDQNIAVQRAYIALKGDLDKFESIEDYYKEIDEEVYNYIVDEMTESVLVDYEDDGNGGLREVWEDIVCSGIPSAPRNLTFIACGRMDGTGANETFVLESTENNGVAQATAATFKVSVAKGGVINITGEAASVKVFSTDGTLLWSAAGTGSLNTGLGNGIYVVKAVSVDGDTVTLKTIL